MPYVLRAVIARREVLAEPPPWIADSAVVELPRGFAMIPVSRALCGQFGPADRPWLYPAHSIFTNLPDALVPRLADLSRRGRVAYVEAEYHGGGGEQRSIGWENGDAREAEESSFAIDSALRWLGVERSGDADCFDTLGLGRHRDVEDWIAAAHPPPTEPAPAAPPDPPPAPGRRPWWRFWG